MEAMKEDRLNQFFNWLSKFVSSAQLSELYEVFTDLEVDLSSHNFYHHLVRPLIETYNADDIDQLYNDFVSNQRFKRSFKSASKLSLIQYYARYCRENQVVETGEPPKESISSGDPLIDRLKRDGISYVDNRPKNGALWIPKGSKTDDLINDAKTQGIHFIFSESKQQWWTRDLSSKESENKENIDPIIVKRNQQDFMRWLKDERFDMQVLFSVYGTARKIHAMLIKNGSTFGLFGFADVKRVQSCISTIRGNREFIKNDLDENGIWTRTLDCYLCFVESEAYVSEPAITEQVSFELQYEPFSVSILPSQDNLFNDKYKEDIIGESSPGLLKKIESVQYREDKDTSLEPSLLALLQGEQLALLRETLVNKGVRTMEEFKQLNLWVFMNQNGLYTIGQRQKVYSDVLRALKPDSSKENTSKWKMSTQEQDYFAPSPAEVLIEYCRSIVVKYPLKFRGLVGARLTGTNIIPLSRIRLSDSDLLLDNPKAYIDGKIDAQKALSYARWIGTMCRVKDLPQLVTCVLPEKEGGKLDSQDNETGNEHGQIASFDKDEDYSLTKPISVAFKGNIALTDSWPSVYENICRWLCDSHMIRPQELANGDFELGNEWHYANPDIKRNELDPYEVLADHVSNLSATDIMRRICKLLRFVGATDQFLIRYRSDNTDQKTVPKTIPEKTGTQIKHTVVLPFQKKAEELVLAADLEGMTLDQLYQEIPSATMAMLKQIRDNSLVLVDIADKLIHVDAFVDWKDGAQKLEEILEKLLNKNNGYVSISQLYEYARAEMQMFLNDNNMDDPRKVFDMAEHLFEKENYHGKRYTFRNKMHISRSEDSVGSNLDVIRKYASDHNGFFRYDELTEYLLKVGVKIGNLRVQMQLGDKPRFLYYSGEEIISAESMQINEAWLDQAGKALKRLFENEGDHVVLRSINPIWYEQMPTLPGYLPWTPLLLQYIVKFYGRVLNAKTIGSEVSQKYDVVHAMLVTRDSEIQTFADAVVAYLVDEGIPERQFEAEELRRKLVDGGLIAGSELLSNMPKAIGSDPRFAWDVSGGKVNIKV